MKMSGTLKVACAFVALCCASQLSMAAQEITKDLSHGAQFKFKIGASLPEFTFEVVPEVNPADTYGNAQSTVKRIDVFRGNSEKPFQQLEGCDLGEMEAPPNGSDWFLAEDFNFDGYKDVFLMTWWGATGNHGGCIWLYNPSRSDFEYSKELSQLPWRRLEPATKTIFTFENGGAVGRVYDANRYRVEDNKPVLIWHEHQDLDDAKHQFHCTAEKLKGNKMVSSKDLWSKPTADPLDAPCDPGRLFP